MNRDSIHSAWHILVLAGYGASGGRWPAGPCHGPAGALRRS